MVECVLVQFFKVESVCAGENDSQQKTFVENWLGGQLGSSCDDVFIDQGEEKEQ